MKGNKNKILIVVIVCAILIGGAGIAVGNMLRAIKEEEKNLVNVPIELSQVQDGEYEGHSETTLVKVDVKVTVQSGKIVNVEIVKHQCGKGEPANAIVDDMVKENTYEVDVVSGATMSSKVIMNAVNNALQKGL